MLENSENDSVYRKSVLMIASQEILMNLKDGGKRESNRNYKLLKTIFGEGNIELIMFTNYSDYSSEDEGVIRLRSYWGIIDRGINIISGRLFTNKKNEEWIIRYIQEKRFDIIFLERSLYGSLVCKLKKAHVKCEIWIFVHNIEKNYFYNKMKKNLLLRSLVYPKIEESEEKTFEYSDRIFSLTNRDAELIKNIYGKQINAVIPTTFEDKFDLNKCVSHSWNRKELLFIGSMFGPNYEGIKWFCKNVMKELPEYTLKIVGKDFEVKRRELVSESNNIEVIGTVDNLEPYYYADNVMVMPIFYGDGQKVKTAEAMMYGKIIIATDEALEGYQVQNIEGILRCNSKNEFVSCIRNLQSKVIWESARNSVRKLFQEKYEFERVATKCKYDFF